MLGIASGRWALPMVVTGLFVMGPLWPGGLTPVTGDAPHYLVIADSIWTDGDLDLVDDYEAWTGTPIERAHLAARADGTPTGHSAHLPFVSFVVAPGWALFGLRGALTAIAVVAALTAVAMRNAGAVAGSVLNRDSGIPWLAALALLVTPAVFGSSRTVMSEMVSAAALAVLAATLIRAERDPATSPPLAYLAASLAAAATPWTHLRYVPAAAVLCAALVWVHRRSRTGLALVPAAALVVSGLSVLTYFRSVFGSWSPSAPYPDKPGPQAPTLRRALAPFADGHVGLLFVALAAFVAVALGFGALRKRFPIYTAAAGLCWLSSTVLVIVWIDYRLGVATPGRFWTPLLPLACPFIVAAASNRRRQTLLAAATIPGLVLAAIFAVRPFTAINGTDDGMTLLWHRLHLDALVPNLAPTGSTLQLATGLALTATALFVGLRLPAKLSDHDADH